MKVTFRETGGMVAYRGVKSATDLWRNGETRDVKAAVGEHLLKTHPANFVEPAEYKAEQAEAAAAAHKAANPATPAGDPKAASQPGETAGEDLSALTPAEKELYAAAAKKVDLNQELTAEEQAVFDKLEAAEATAAANATQE